MRNLILSLLLLGSSQLILAQDIFEQHGFDKAPLSLSNGQYNEFFNSDEVVQIGSVLLNTKTNKVVAFVEDDTTTVSLKSDLSMRWLTLDPLARKYYQISPYVYVADNPIKLIDPNGKEIKGFTISSNGNIEIGKNASKSAIQIYNAMSQTKTGTEAFKAMISMPTQIKLKLSNSGDFMGETTGNKVREDGYYDKAKIVINKEAINSKESRFSTQEEGINATGVHEKTHLEPGQIEIDSKRDLTTETREEYYSNETAPFNNEYDAREDYRIEKGMENSEWKTQYESTTDSKGNSKPSYKGTKKQEDEKE